MSEVIEQHIAKTSIRKKFFNIPTIKKKISLRQLTYLRKDLPSRRVAHTNPPTHGMVRPPTQIWQTHLYQQAKYGKEYPTGDTKR